MSFREVSLSIGHPVILFGLPHLNKHLSLEVVVFQPWVSEALERLSWSLGPFLLGSVE